MERKDVESIPSETAAGRDRTRAELRETEQLGEVQANERFGDLNEQTPGLDEEEAGQKSGRS